MKMTKRSRKLLLSAGMLAAVATITPAPQAEAACSITCPDGTVFTCQNLPCWSFPEYGELYCGRFVYECP